MKLETLRSRLPMANLARQGDAPSVRKLDIGMFSQYAEDRRISFTKSLQQAMQFMPKTKLLVEEMYSVPTLFLSKGVPYIIFEGLDEGDVFFYISGVPSNATQSLGQIDVFYRQLDGFCDLNMQGDFFPSDWLALIV